jgi:dolichol-phosphate mannosyltransferase
MSTRTDTIDVVVPTFREARNIPLLIERLDVLRVSHALHLTIVDDNSRDGTEETIQRLNLPWGQFCRANYPPRIESRRHGGVEMHLRGYHRRDGADLSHPPEAIPSCTVDIGFTE